jgi:hypothetical protein
MHVDTFGVKYFESKIHAQSNKWNQPDKILDYWIFFGKNKISSKKIHQSN